MATIYAQSLDYISEDQIPFTQIQKRDVIVVIADLLAGRTASKVSSAAFEAWYTTRSGSS